MATFYNKTPSTSGLYTNGAVSLATNTNFSSYTVYQEDSLSGQYCYGMTTNRYGSQLFSNEYIPVDTSKVYQSAVSVKTLKLSYNNRLGSGHLGFACYDKNKTYIDLRNCGDIGNTVLTRDLNPGDSSLYIASTSGWSTYSTPYPNGDGTFSLPTIFRNFILFPATHPEYNIPWQYTRIGWGQYNLYYKSTFTLMPEGDWRLDICDANNNDAVMPNIGYPTPIGTPVSNGKAGSAFNYVHGAPEYPTTWTTYASSIITGEGILSSFNFRYATKYIRFLNLANYNYRTESAGASAYYLLDNIMFVECKNGKPYDKSFFSRTNLP